MKVHLIDPGVTHGQVQVKEGELQRQRVDPGVAGETVTLKVIKPKKT